MQVNEYITILQLITSLACIISSNSKVPSEAAIASMLKLNPVKHNTNFMTQNLPMVDKEANLGEPHKCNKQIYATVQIEESLCEA